MAYMNQERKAKLVPGIKKVCAKYGVKATVSTNRFTISINIKSGKLDFIGNFIKSAQSENAYRLLPRDIEQLKKTTYIQVNEYHIDMSHTGECAKFLHELKAAACVGNHDNSDIQSDYFDVGWYIDINIGKWNKPYLLEV